MIGYRVTFCEGEYFNDSKKRTVNVPANNLSDALTKIYLMFWGTTIFVYSMTEYYLK